MSNKNKNAGKNLANAAKPVVKTDNKSAADPQSEKAPEVKPDAPKGGLKENTPSSVKVPPKPTAKIETPTEPVKVEKSIGDPSGKEPVVVEPAIIVEETKPATGNAAASAAVFNAEETRCLLAKLDLTPDAVMDSNHVVTLLQVATERFRGADRTDPKVIATNDMLDELTLHSIVIAGVSMHALGKKMGLRIPVESLDTYARAFGYFGVALPVGEAASVEGDPTQLNIPFTGVSAATEAVAKAEIVSHKKTAPEMDAQKWLTDEDAKKALAYIMSDTLSKDNRFVVCMDKLREFKVKNAKDDAEKQMWTTASAGTMFEALLANIGDTASTLMNGIGGQVYSSIATLKSPIKAHLTIKARIPNCTDQEIHEIIMAIIRYKADKNNPGKPLESNIAYLGASSGTREECLIYPARVTKDDREIMGRLQGSYVAILGIPGEEGYALKATNLLLTIINLYKTKDLFSLYVEKEYPEAVNTAIVAAGVKHVEPSKQTAEPAPAPTATEASEAPAQA